MIQGLLWIIGSFGFSILVAHMLNRRFHKNRDTVIHYVFLTRNNQNIIEWHLRSVFFAAWLEGKSVTVTILDEASIDETLAIVGRLPFRDQLDVHSLQQPQEMDEWMIPQPNEQMVIIPLKDNGLNNETNGYDNESNMLH